QVDPLAAQTLLEDRALVEAERQAFGRRLEDLAGPADPQRSAVAGLVQLRATVGVRLDQRCDRTGTPRQLLVQDAVRVRQHLAGAGTALERADDLIAGDPAGVHRDRSGPFRADDVGDRADRTE